VITAQVDGVTGQLTVTVTRAPVLSIEVDGFVERGAVVRFRVTRAGAPVPAGQWQVSVTPAGALTPLGGDSARLNQTGNATVVIDASDATGSRVINVAAPPRVFFDRIVAGNRDIYRVDLDGQALTRLTTDPGTDQDPTVGGGRVVFVSFRTGSADLWSIASAGGAETRVTTAGANETTPALSPDGQRLAYAYDGDLVSKLWTAAGDGSGAARATAGFGFNGSIESSPGWAPAGSRLVFMSTAAGSADIYDFSPGGGTPVAVAPSSAADVEPAWSPDGQMVAFVSTREGSTDIFVIRLATGAITRLTTGSATEGQPAWIPDSRRIVFTDFSGGTRRLAWLDVQQPGITHPIQTGDGRAENPAVEP
jgi:TolB protein